MRTIIIYPGRFQPFGPHHFKSYQWICQRFGSENVFIATSNHTDENSPLTFEEKKKCILKYQVNEKNVIQVRNPYKCEEITSKFNPNETAVIFSYGEKDFGRINFTKKDGTSGYLQEYYGQKNLYPLSKCGYAMEMPHIQVKIGNDELSGTYLRKTLPLVNRDEFQAIMGYFDEELHNLFKSRFHPDIVEIVESILIEDSNRISRTQLQRIEQYADKLFVQFGIDVNFQDLSKDTHFYQRLNDPRNQTPITGDELRQLFKKASVKYGSKLGSSSEGIEGVLVDMQTDINLPFMIKFDAKNRELDLIPKTIMRKKGFSSTSQLLKMETFSKVIKETVKKNYSKHLMHPFDDPEMTFDGLEKLLHFLLNGTDASIKFDGHNLQVTFKDGQVLASRNKGTIINPMTIEAVREKFSDRPELETTFVSAMQAISKLITSSKLNLGSIFNNGRTFLNVEICDQRAKNIYDYGKVPILSLHSLITYDELGNELGRTSEIPDEFTGNEAGYLIQITPKVKLQKTDNDIAELFLSRLNSIRERGSYRKSDLIHSINPRSMEEIKLLIFRVGNELIRNSLRSFKTSRESIPLIINIIQDSKELAKANKVDKLKYETSLKNLMILGGFQAINPIEGLVIEHGEKTFKFTGTFGVLVSIFGIWNKKRYAKV